MCLNAVYNNAQVQYEHYFHIFENYLPILAEKIIRFQLIILTFLGIIILALIAKYVQHWRYIQLALNIPTLATLLYIW